MHLIYFDESGNTGNNLADDSQPIFLLCALAVPADRWQIIENDLTEARRTIYPDPIPEDFEMHGSEIISPGKKMLLPWQTARRPYRALSVVDRYCEKSCTQSLLPCHRQKTLRPLAP